MDLRALFVEHHEGLFRYLERMTGDAEVAADAVQETFLKLAESPPPDPTHIGAWIYTVATNQVRETLRTQRRRRELLEVSSHRVPVANPGPDPAASAERREARKAVELILAGLTERERTILLMREEGFKHREIAAAVGTTTKSVGTLITRALRKAAKLIEETNA
jgi:RNA polymerase sigma-70 factor (ECF subfamily)